MVVQAMRLTLGSSSSGKLTMTALTQDDDHNIWLLTDNHNKHTSELDSFPHLPPLPSPPLPSCPHTLTGRVNNILVVLPGLKVGERRATCCGVGHHLVAPVYHAPIIELLEHPPEGNEYN